MKKLLQLFLTFFKLGAFTFGGGYAMISLIENEVVDKRGWLTRDEMLDIITIAESTPGPLAVNMATFVGTKIKGFFGAVIATLGLIIPPFVIIALISLVLNEFKEIALVAYALKGIQAGVVVLIFNAFLKFFKGMEKSVISFIFLIVAFLVALFTDFSVVLLLLIGGVVGVSISLISSSMAKKRLAKSNVANPQNADTSSGVTPDDTSSDETSSSIDDSVSVVQDETQDMCDDASDTEDSSSLDTSIDETNDGKEDTL